MIILKTACFQKGLAVTTFVIHKVCALRGEVNRQFLWIDFRERSITALINFRDKKIRVIRVMEYVLVIG